MEIGFVPDPFAQIIRSHWHPGTATEKTFTGNLKLDKDSMIPITRFAVQNADCLNSMRPNNWVILILVDWIRRKQVIRNIAYRIL